MLQRFAHAPFCGSQRDMDSDRTEHAMRRIDSALARVEAALARPRSGDPALEAKHVRLREAVVASLGELDKLLAEQPQ
jgi:hypothetical protein